MDAIGGGGDGYASPPSEARDYCDQPGRGDIDRGLRSYRSLPCSNPHSQRSSERDFASKYYAAGVSDHGGDNQGSTRFSGNQSGSLHSSVKDFGSSQGSGENGGDAKEASEYACGGQFEGDHGFHEAHRNGDYGPQSKGYVRPGMSWWDRRSFHSGETCADPLDWDHHPLLRQVPQDERQNFRQTKLEEWLSTAHKRKSKERFGAYIWRASALANSELKHRKKQCWGDEYEDPLDKFVMRLFYGMTLKLERTESVVLCVDEETHILQILREECDELSNSGQLPVDQRSIQFTPLIMSEMQDRCHS